MADLPHVLSSGCTITRIEQGSFFPAEAYHQHFYDRNPDYPYIVTYDQPKVAAFRAGFPQLAQR